MQWSISRISQYQHQFYAFPETNVRKLYRHWLIDMFCHTCIAAAIVNTHVISVTKEPKGFGTNSDV